MSFSVCLARITGVDLHQLSEILREHNRMYDHVDSPDWPPDEPLRLGWNVRNNGAPEVITSGDGDTYNVILTFPAIHRAKRRTHWYDEEEHVLLPYRERVNAFGKDTVFFASGEDIWCAVFASSKSDDTKWTLRTLLEPYVNVEASPDDFTVPDDMIYWLLSRYRTGQRQIGTVSLADVSGYVGETETGHRIRGQGARIMTHLSTLGLVAESEPLKAVEIEAIVGRDRVVFSVLEDGSCTVDDNSRCLFARVPNVFDQQILLTMFVYTRVLPVLKGEYQAAIRTNTWTRQVREQFVHQVARDLSRLAGNRV